jgi:hypothetical protein
MSREEIVESIVVSYQLRAGMSPTEILVRHYNAMARSVTASDSVLAAEYREARDIMSFVNPKFLLTVAYAVGASLYAIIDLFKDTRIVKFFQEIGWKLENFWSVLKRGRDAARKLADMIADYVKESGVARWTKDEVGRLDEWLKKPENRRTKVLAGVLVAEMLVYLWFVSANTGNIAFDWDLTDAVAALSGSYSLTEIFAGPDGLKLLAILAAGVAGLSFPWPGPTTVHFVGTVITTLAKVVRKRLKKGKWPWQEEAKELGMENALA